MSTLRMRIASTFYGLVTISAGNSTLAAQRLDSLPAGSRISVTLSDSVRQFVFGPNLQELRATLTQVTRDSIYLHVGPATPFAIARSDIRGLFVTRGVQRGRSALSAGLFMASIAGLLAQREERFSIQALQVGAGAVLGATLGALRPYERWKSVRR